MQFFAKTDQGKMRKMNQDFLFATKDGASMRELFLYLKQRHIYIRYFDLPRIDNYVRITIGTDAQMDAFLQGTEVFLRGE